MSGLLDLFLYLAQQGGVLMGVGAAALGLLWYLRGMHDDAPNIHLHAARMVEDVGLALMFISGIIITLQHLVAGEFDVLGSPAFLFKWLLMAIVAVCALSRTPPQSVGSQSVFEGLSAGNWFALLLLDVTAPVTTWPLLFSFYGAWAIFFGVAWACCVAVLHHAHKRESAPVVEEKIPEHVPELKVQSTPVPQVKPAPVAAAVVPTPVIKLKIVPTPAPHPHIAPAPAPKAVHLPAPAPKAPPVVIIKAPVPVPKPALVPEVAPQLLPQNFHPKAAPAPHRVLAAAAPHAPVAAAAAPKPPVMPTMPPKPVISPMPAPAPVSADFDSLAGTLPALRVMPKRPEDIRNEAQGAVVRFI